MSYLGRSKNRNERTCMIKEFESPLYGTIRTSIVEDQPCFNMKDLCHLFGIKSVHTCRTRVPGEGIKVVPVSTDKDKTNNMYFVTAEYLSSCLFLSTKPEAEGISDWLYRIVLPQLIKFNEYNVEDFHDPLFVVRFMDEFSDLKVKLNIMETNLKLNQPKIKSIDRLLGTNSCIDLDMVHEIIRFKGIRNAELLKILRATHVLNDANIPLQEFCDRKYFRVVEAKAISGANIITSKRTYVYQSGITFIERILKDYEGVKHGREEQR